MTTRSHARKSALSLPEVEEGTHFGLPSFAVRGRNFAVLTRDAHVQLHLSDADAGAALAAHPVAEQLVRNGTPIGIRVPLDGIGGKDLNGLLLQAWLAKAPKRLEAERFGGGSEAGGDPRGGDALPAIGRPATAALRAEGITTLDDVAARSERGLLALHGVGPKAVAILREALAAQGRGFRD
ncbi:hypothetical protein ACQ3I4_08380 [Zafaria sp. Z1313]|uniref:hypothetical protein n=1 Tax=Zafaria sp. Z1313 TaxID=3423202 RepID=UPI003D3021BE